MKKRLNPMMEKIVEYLEKHPEGSDKYSMADEINVDERHLTFDLLDLTRSGILKKDTRKYKELPEGGGILVGNHYTLDKKALSKISGA